MSEIAFLSYLMLIIKINFKNNNEDDDRKLSTFCDVLKYGIIKISASSSNFFIKTLVTAISKSFFKLGSWNIDDYDPSQEQYLIIMFNNLRLFFYENKIELINPSPNLNPQKAIFGVHIQILGLCAYFWSYKFKQNRIKIKCLELLGIKYYHASI